MILIDVYVPSLDRIYDFQVEERATVESLILEMAEIIAGQTQTGKSPDSEKFMLCQKEERRILERGGTLIDYGIKNGARLMLV